MTTERCPDCFRPLATADLLTKEHITCGDVPCLKCEAACWRKFNADTCRRTPDYAAQRIAERARFEASRDWRDTGAAEKERHWQTWCAAMRIER